MRWIPLAVAMAISATLVAPANAETVLGSRKVAYKSETDVIPVPGKKRFRAVRLCVSNHAVRFRDVDVVFGNGGRDDKAVRRVIPAGECTRWMDLRGGARNIRRIVLRYDTYGDKGARAVVTAFGR